VTGGGGDDAGEDGAAPPPASKVTTLVPGVPHPQAIAVDATSVYFTIDGSASDDGGVAPRTGSVMRVDRGGGPAQALATQQDWPYAIAVSANGVAWANRGTGQASGGVFFLPTGGTQRTLAAAEEAFAVRVDTSYVYWTSALGAGVVVERASQTQQG